MIPTRRVVASGLLVSACATAAPPTADLVLERAIARAGGAQRLRENPVLRWTGHASIYAGERVIEITTDTVVEPFSYARSRTALRTDPEAVRVLEINESEGVGIVNGERRELPQSLVRHEQQQYAIYGLMRLVPLLDAGEIALSQLPVDAPPRARYALDARHPRAPRTLLMFDEADVLIAADNSVSDAEGEGRLIRQRFLFRGESGATVHWPARIEIVQDGELFFVLSIDTFEMLAARP